MPPPAAAPSADTRRAILDLLRWGPLTAQGLADAVGLTLNGVRAQLAVLERDGLVLRSGSRRRTAPGKPALLFALSEAGEESLSLAYPAALRSLVAALGDRLSEPDLLAVLAGAGERLGRGVRSADPLEVLRGLGGAARLEPGENAGETVVVGGACPLATAVREAPVGCEMVRSLLASTLGREVTMCCQHGTDPRCGFRIAPERSGDSPST
jgi:predicted ArsR family transcriptional regulator